MGLKPEERVIGLKPEQIVEAYKPEEKRLLLEALQRSMEMDEAEAKARIQQNDDTEVVKEMDMSDGSTADEVDDNHSEISSEVVR